jgi:hypothetical protein
VHPGWRRLSAPMRVQLPPVWLLVQFRFLLCSHAAAVSNELKILLMTAKRGPYVLFCMPDRLNCILLVPLASRNWLRWRCLFSASSKVEVGYGLRATANVPPCVNSRRYKPRKSHNSYQSINLRTDGILSARPQQPLRQPRDSSADVA